MISAKSVRVTRGSMPDSRTDPNAFRASGGVSNQILVEKTSISAQAAWPWRVQVIGRRGSDHLHSTDLSVFDEKRLGHKNAAGAIEAGVAVLGAIGQHALIDRALVEHAVCPDDATFEVDERVAAPVDVLHDVIQPHLELRQAIHGEQVDRAR